MNRNSHIEQIKKEAIYSRRVPMGAEQRLILLQKLQGQLSIQPLFDLFCEELRKQIDISRIIWDHQGISHIIEKKDKSNYSQTFAIKYGKNPLGILQYNTPYPLDADEINLLHNYHRLLAGPLHNALQYNKVYSMALTDNLTGLYNRMSFDEDLLRAIAFTERNDHGLVLMILDMNKFKEVNDNYGHLEGDKILVRFAEILKQTIRKSDRCYRLGGDEFGVILTPATKDSAIKMHQRLKQFVQQDPILNQHDISSSAGCALYKEGDSCSSMYSRADRSMYNNKKR